MKKLVITGLVAFMTIGTAACTSSTATINSASSSPTSIEKLVKVPEEDRPRAIITTDVECDDMNSLMHLSLYFNEVDLEGIVYSASKYHFNGDGQHTLGDVTPNYLCEGQAVIETNTGSSQPDPNAKTLTHYRDIPKGWIEDLWDNEYSEVYANLIKNDLNYPTPDYLKSITKYGNIDFEGDVRQDTDGSNLIKNAILDDDQRKLYVFSWGGVNTVVRALLSIADENKNSVDWAKIQKKVTDKVVISGNGQDNSWADNKIDELYPGIVTMKTSKGYAAYFAPLCVTDDHDSKNMTYMMATTPDVNYTFKGNWLNENIKSNHGALMGKYNLMGDGTKYDNEPDRYQYGLNPTIDWGYQGFPATTFEKYDFLAEGDSSGFMALLNNGLRGMENGKYGSWAGIITYSNQPTEAIKDYNYLAGTEGNSNRFLLAYQQDWAARADWCVNDYSKCNHAPRITVENEEIEVEAGKPVQLSATVVDPDGNNVSTSWWYYKEGSQYSGNASDIRVWSIESTQTGFTVPSDAKSGDFFNLVIEAKDNTETPMTRYNQVIVKVK